MSNIQNFLVSLSLVSWLMIIVFELVWKKKYWRFGIQLFLIIITALTLNAYWGYFNTIEFKGGSVITEGWILCGLYIATVLGIIGHHVFIQVKELHEQVRQPKFKWMPVIKPLVISPIIFLAVLNQLEQLSIQTHTTKVMITQFILAFQNGFFWKTILEQLEKKQSSK